MPLLRDQLPDAYAKWAAAAGGEDKVLDDRFRLWALASNVISVTVEDAKLVGDDLALSFKQYNRVLLSLKQ